MFYKVFFGVITITIIIFTIFCLNVDNSDKNFFERNSLTIETDYLTGCQYFESLRGGITPRLDKDGKQVCIEVNNAK